MKRSPLLFGKTLLFCLLLLTGSAFSQTCSFTNPDTIICQGATVSFNLTTSGAIPATYSWDFGNGFTSNTESPSHTYTTAGIFTPKVLVKFVGGATCNASGKAIRVRAAPVANFSITTSKQMCFKGNELCVQDLSAPGTSNAPIKQRVYQLSNGHLQIDTPPYAAQICYQNNTDILGHMYTLVMEVTDTNNCVSRLEKKDSAEVFAKFETLSYSADTQFKCNVTVANFTNTSLMPRSRVLKFQWQFGDGAVDSVNWFFTSHSYTSKDTCYPILIVTDQQNCIDTLQPGFYVTVFFPDAAIYETQPSTQCYKGNFFAFKSKNKDVTFDWSIYDGNGNEVYDLILNEDDSLMYFYAQTCGLFKVRSTVIRGAYCTIVTDSFIHVMGPKAIIDSKVDQVVNARQCSIRDTVYFKTPVPYLSCTYQNGAGMKHFWDFGDAFAPQCTVDTRNGINIGMNCNFSKDSMVVKHFYTPGKEGCYAASLYMIDTISGCEHTTFKPLPLMTPDASPDTTANPKRRGLRFFQDREVKCLNQPVIFDFLEVLPACDYTIAYMYLDSACDTCRWIPTDTLKFGMYETFYSYTTDSNGYVTVGLIIGNGNINGEMCYDTAWYHYFLQLYPIHPLFNVFIAQECGPYPITVIPIDTIQYHLTKVSWVITAANGGSFKDTFSQVFGPNDSIVHSHQRQILLPGIYNILSVYENTNGCRSIYTTKISIGNRADFGASKRVLCLDDSAEVFSAVNYINALFVGGLDPERYWDKPERELAGKEKVWWDMGDGNGFLLTGGSVKFKYDTPGTYTVTMVYRDSIGCMDTIVKPNYFAIVDTKAHAGILQQQYYCAPQIVVFNNASFVYDSLPIGAASSYDTIAGYQWIFGDNTPESALREPAHNYTRNGIYNVMMVATSGSGCRDTDYVQVDITGPKPSFVIPDTVGCAPFTVLLDNTTGKQLKNWTWYFGDSANQTITVLNDSDVQFTYTKPGVYSIRLLGSQDVVNPNTGNTINCNSFFPDPITDQPVRKVYVIPVLPVGLSIADSVCMNQEVSMTASVDTSFTQLVWKISNGVSILLNKPDSVSTYQFDSVGVFDIQLIPLQNPVNQCWDSASTQIYVFDVKADFEIDSSKSPQYVFNNLSAGASVYHWDFGKPASGAINESNTTTGVFDFGMDTATYQICLKAINTIGCEDSVCKTIRINQKRLFIPNVFTPENNDGYNDAFDIDILGFTEYHLVIYNRWGAKVFEGLQDGYQNDGINWNGNDHQTGPPCAAGTYYYIFTYKFYTESESETAHGSITLIRNK